MCVCVCPCAALTATSGQFAIAPSDVTVNETGLVEVDCTYPSAQSISWERAGNALTSGISGYTISSMGNSSQLVITSARRDHAGSYACIAVLDGGQRMRAEFSLVVQCESTKVVLHERVLYLLMRFLPICLAPVSSGYACM